MTTMAAKSKCFGIFSYSLCISALFLACLTYVYINWILEINNCLKYEDVSKWREFLNRFSITEDNRINNCNLWLWKTHQNAISKAFQDYFNAFNFKPKETYLSILFGILVISILVLLSCLCCRKTKTIPTTPTSPGIELSDENAKTHFKNTESHFDIRKCILMMFFTTLVVSVPWEFVRLYQREISKRAASVSQGAPDDCSERSTSVFQSIKLFLQWQFSWSPLNNCETYYYRLLVDPIWELTPLLVISSALTRCLLHPIELLFSGMGRSFRAFFVEIPAQWQPVLLVILTFIFLILMLMTCSYRLQIPLLFKIEPKTPVYIQDCRHGKTKQNSFHLTNGNGSYISSPNQNSSYINRALTNRNGSYISSPNQSSSYLYEISENRNSSNLNFSLCDVPNKQSSKPSDTLNVNNRPGRSTSSDSFDSNMTKKRKYTKKSKEQTRSNTRKVGGSTPKSQSTRARRSRKLRYEDDPDF